MQPGGEDEAKALGRLLGLKNDAEYGLATVSRANRELALRQARKLVEFAAAWEPLENKRASRIAYRLQTGGWRDDSSEWPELQEEMTDGMIRLEKALRPS